MTYLIKESTKKVQQPRPHPSPKYVHDDINWEPVETPL